MKKHFVCMIHLIALIFYSKASEKCRNFITPFEQDFSCYQQNFWFKDGSIALFKIKQKNQKKTKLAVLKASYCTSDEQIEKANKDFTMVSSFNHPNIVKKLSNEIRKVTNENHNYCLTVEEFAENGNLFHYLFEKKQIEKFNDLKKLELFFQIAKGVKAIHEKGIIHADLKLEKIFMKKNGLIKITDFNLSFSGPQSTYEFHGTLPYKDPFLLNSFKKFGKYNFDYHVDIHSLGVIFYVLMFKSFPFIAEDSEHMLEVWTWGKVPMESCKLDFAFLVLHLLALNPTKRPNIDQLLEWIVFIYRNYERRPELFEKPHTFHDFPFDSNDLLRMNIASDHTGFISLGDSGLLESDLDLKHFFEVQSTEGRLDWTPFELKDFKGDIGNFSKSTIERLMRRQHSLDSDDDSETGVTENDQSPDSNEDDSPDPKPKGFRQRMFTYAQNLLGGRNHSTRNQNRLSVSRITI